MRNGNKGENERFFMVKHLVVLDAGTKISCFSHFSQRDSLWCSEQPLLLISLSNKDPDRPLV